MANKISQALQRALDYVATEMPTTEMTRGSVSFTAPDVEKIVAQSPWGQGAGMIEDAIRRRLGGAAPAWDVVKAIGMSPYTIGKEAFMAGGNVPMTLLNTQSTAGRKAVELGLGTVLPLATAAVTSKLAGKVRLPKEAMRGMAGVSPRITGAAVRGALSGAGFNLGATSGRGIMEQKPVGQIARDVLMTTPQAAAGGALIGAGLQGITEVPTVTRAVNRMINPPAPRAPRVKSPIPKMTPAEAQMYVKANEVVGLKKMRNESVMDFAKRGADEIERYYGADVEARNLHLSLFRKKLAQMNMNDVPAKWAAANYVGDRMATHPETMALATREQMAIVPKGAEMMVKNMTAAERFFSGETGKAVSSKNMWSEQLPDGTRVLYSYGRHYPMAVIKPDGKAYLNTEGYSVTTSGHINRTRRAAAGTGYNLKEIPSTDAMKNILDGADEETALRAAGVGQPPTGAEMRVRATDKSGMPTLKTIRQFEETGFANVDDEAIAMQQMIEGGQGWKLQGSYGRSMMDAIESGRAMLGAKPTSDYYGNRIPSRTEVQAGTKGSPEYVANTMGVDYLRNVLGFKGKLKTEVLTTPPVGTEMKVETPLSPEKDMVRWTGDAGEKYYRVQNRNYPDYGYVYQKINGKLVRAGNYLSGTPPTGAEMAVSGGRTINAASVPSGAEMKVQDVNGIMDIVDDIVKRPNYTAGQKTYALDYIRKQLATTRLSTQEQVAVDAMIQNEMGKLTPTTPPTGAEMMVGPKDLPRLREQFVNLYRMVNGSNEGLTSEGIARMTPDQLNREISRLSNIYYAGEVPTVPPTGAETKVRPQPQDLMSRVMSGQVSPDEANRLLNEAGIAPNDPYRVALNKLLQNQNVLPTDVPKGAEMRVPSRNTRARWSPNPAIRQGELLAQGYSLADADPITGVAIRNLPTSTDVGTPPRLLNYKRQSIVPEGAEARVKGQPFSTQELQREIDIINTEISRGRLTPAQGGQIINDMIKNYGVSEGGQPLKVGTQNFPAGAEAKLKGNYSKAMWDWLDEQEGLPKGTSWKNVEREAVRQGYGAVSPEGMNSAVDQYVNLYRKVYGTNEGLSTAKLAKMTPSQLNRDIQILTKLDAGLPLAQGERIAGAPIKPSEPMNWPPAPKGQVNQYVLGPTFGSDAYQFVVAKNKDEAINQVMKKFNVDMETANNMILEQFPYGSEQMVRPATPAQRPQQMPLPQSGVQAKGMGPLDQQTLESSVDDILQILDDEYAGQTMTPADVQGIVADNKLPAEVANEVVKRITGKVLRAGQEFEVPLMQIGTTSKGVPYHYMPANEYEYASTIMRMGPEGQETVKFGSTNGKLTVVDDITDWFDDIVAGARQWKGEGYRGYHETPINPKYVKLSSGWITGMPDETTTRKADLGAIFEKIQSGEIVPPRPIYWLFEPTSNVFSTASDILVKKADIGAITNWLKQAFNLSKQDLQAMFD